MSSVAKTSPQLQQQSSSEITTKKKFGKNLNKLTKPPPPTSSSSAKSNANSRNGLLLLSTKRPSSGNNAATTGGILASKTVSGTPTKPLPSLGLQNKSSTSTHDALLGAVVGASRAESQEPDAWGVAEKQKSPTNEFDSMGSEMHQGGGQDIAHGLSYQETAPSPDRMERIVAQSSPDLPSTNWDEYGGRNLSANGNAGLYNPANDLTEDDQKAAMARMARERADMRRNEEESRQYEQREKAAQKLRELDDKKAVSDDVPSRTLFDPSKPSKDSFTTPEKLSNLQNGASLNGAYTPETPGDSHDAYSRQPIQLSSYDDRDRGERGGSAAPRMLYDPKSGSMVAVPSRDDSAAGVRGRKERGKKPVKTTRDKEVKPDSKQDADSTKGKKGKREKKPTVDSPSTAKPEPKKKPSKERKLPRTRGVLYSRDNKGNFVCSDGCDGDLGYGAHSVPGGRVKNADAYTSFLEEQKRAHLEDDGLYKESAMDTSFEDGNHHVTLHTGFSIPEPQEVRFDWVKPSDKIELITGIDDSPTLQATAKEWAPSQAALAAAAAAARFEGGVREPIQQADSLDGEDEDEEEEDEGPVSPVAHICPSFDCSWC